MFVLFFKEEGKSEERSSESSGMAMTRSDIYLGEFSKREKKKKKKKMTSKSFGVDLPELRLADDTIDVQRQKKRERDKGNDDGGKG